MEEIYSQKQLDQKILTYFRGGWSQDDTYKILRDFYNVYDYVKLTRAYVRQKFKELKQDNTEFEIRKANMRYIREQKISKKSRFIGLQVRLGIIKTTDPDFKAILEGYGDGD
ncbi:MAG: hypothetical protein ACP5G1_03575 [Nanopusillaceae archaeon]